jgi:hypothetical protein
VSGRTEGEDIYDDARRLADRYSFDRTAVWHLPEQLGEAAAASAGPGRAGWRDRLHASSAGWAVRTIAVWLRLS